MTKETESLFNFQAINGLLVTTKIILVFLTFVFVLSYPTSAMAYVGIGPGITSLWSLLTVIIAILLTVGGFLAWPIRAVLRRKKRTTTKSENQDSSESDKKNSE